MRNPLVVLVLTLALAAGATACEKKSAGWQPARPSFRQFQTEVLPVLLRDCAFSTCHGSNERFFRVWGPGRTRINPMTSNEFDPLTGDEASNSYQLALSMIDSEQPSRSLLLRKPLAIEAGGAGHRGADKFGRNIYRTVNDAGYLSLAHWVFSVTDNP
jgi:hypothetical protein